MIEGMKMVSLTAKIGQQRGILIMAFRSILLIVLVLALATFETSLSFTIPVAIKPRTSSSLYGKVKLVYGNKSAMVAEGSKMSAACSKLGYKPKYSCKK